MMVRDSGLLFWATLYIAPTSGKNQGLFVDVSL